MMGRPDRKGAHGTADAAGVGGRGSGDTWGRRRGPGLVADDGAGVLVEGTEGDVPDAEVVHLIPPAGGRAPTMPETRGGNV